MARIAPHRRLRRLRGVLVLLAAATALLAAAAFRLESTARGVAAVGALACLVAWLVVLEAEGRMADGLERRGARRRLIGRGRATHRPGLRRETPRRAA